MNMKARRKPSAYGVQGWIAPGGFQQKQTLPLDEYYSNLDLIVSAIDIANKEYLSIVKEYLRWQTRSSRQRLNSSPRSERFNDNDLRMLETAIQSTSQTGHSSVPHLHLIGILGERSYVDIWERAAENMAYLKNHPKHQRQKHQENGKKRAETMKRCRIAIEDSFSLIEQDLRAQGLDSARGGILLKIDMLRKYEEAYPMAPEHHPVFLPKLQTPNLLVLVSICTLISFIPLGMAWTKAANIPGSTEDAGFYIQIQNVIYQCVGLIITVYTVRQRSEENCVAWIRALWLAGVGILCALVSIPMYLYIPTMWSVLALFGASTAQLSVLLELSLMDDHSKLKLP
ncbi:hypothetical protein F4804DRAFT_102270 [Jackrogersella minutella]|nr:hypothetical protein F4804DRAFT_102270 [Jackrogersella minutella]